METEDYIIEDIINNKPQKKKINCSIKGKSNEREIVKKLNTRFSDILSLNEDWGLFSRTVGSGNRFYQVSLSNNAKQVFSSDICAPPSFKFTIESKAGYNTIDLCSVFDSGCHQIDDFLQQAEKDGKKSNKQPMVLWKKDRRPRLAFLKLENNIEFKFNMKYEDWTIVSFDELLKLPDTFFFDVY